MPPTDDATPITDEFELAKAAWAQIQSVLEQQRVRIQEEIAHYPPPIPACDAQFNHLSGAANPNCP